MLDAAMLLMGARAVNRAHASVPYTGTAAVRTLSTFVNANDGALAVVRELGDGKAAAFYDTVRGATQRSIHGSNEDVASAFAFSGRQRVYTGAVYNALTTNYASWHFHQRPGFLSIVTFAGGAGSTAHTLAESPKLAIAFRRTGTTGPKVVYWFVGDSYRVQDQTFTNGAAFSAYSSSAFTPSSSVFLSGNTYVVYLFGTSSTHATVGGYNGTVTGGVVGSLTEALPFAPSWGLVMGPINDLALTTYYVSVYDRRIAGTVPAGGYGPGWEGLYPSNIALPLEVSGTDLIASSLNNGNPSAHRSACLDLGEYRYLFIR